VSWPHEAIALLETGTVVEISLDHDLGDDARGTGYDVILWMERAVAMEGFKPPRIRVHSANASARIKMEAGVEAIDRLSGGRRRTPPSVGVKVGADGVPLAFKGSTLISPVSERTDPRFYRRLVEIYEDLPQRNIELVGYRRSHGGSVIGRRIKSDWLPRPSSAPALS
jgi:hypothetical protein